MFCEKCGRPIDDGSAFCNNCGAPVQAQPAQEQPVQEQPVQTQAPASPQEQFPDGSQQYGYSYAPAAPAAPKQPMSPKTKKIILFSAIGAGVLAVILVLLFVVIIPMIKDANTTKISLADYRTVQFDNVDYDNKSAENEVLEGKIGGKMVWNYKKLANDIKVDLSTAKNIVKNYVSYLSTEQTLNGETFSRSFSDASKNDVIKVTVYWPGDDGTIINEFTKNSLDEKVDKLEEQFDIKIKRETTTAEIKISDVLEEQKVSVKEPVKVDLLGKIVDGNYIETYSNYSEYCNVRLKPFSIEDNGYTFKHKSNSSYVVVCKNEKELKSLYISFSSRSYLRDGDITTLSIGEDDANSLEKIGITLTKTSIDYTVKYEAETTAPTTEPETTAPTTAPATTAPETTAPSTTAPETTAANTTEATKAA